MAALFLIRVDMVVMYEKVKDSTIGKKLDPVTHHGEITEIDNNTVKVRVAVDDSCSSCPASGLCKVGGGDTAQIFTVYVGDPGAYSVGDKVEIEGSEKYHRKAIRLATLYPTLAIIAVMVGIKLLTGSDLVAALGGLGTMVLCFLALYLCRKRLAPEFAFSIRRKLDAD